MIGVVRVKPGVCFDLIAPAGFRILGALDRTARRLSLDLTITCGTEAHLDTDPHSLGEAYDIRTHDLTAVQARSVLRALLIDLSDDDPPDVPKEVSGGLATRRFFGFVENPGGSTEHLHVQRRSGTVYGRLPTPRKT